ncbi:adenine deaminase [Liquorilactobacillus capillatus]|uniref:Adenine deaminase n=1 Tax=Liquorilactobacillus capillatus DSM 19910 TaxID=1423731 RepID=A0A0R1M349_9LACO|nr:adenine deaminase [Liquorilactobacillus capillatus]KRL02439.1 adenine deaminase [Liquorilactobacillus capillatus DSM 19910]
MKELEKCIKNGQVLNVFSRQFEKKTLWIDHGMIVATGDNAELRAAEEINAHNAYLVPGMIDAHVHIESSMVAPSELGKVLLQKGVTAIVTDPHEIANVCGVSGIEYMLEDAAQTQLDVFIMLPSSVPCTPFEHNGATLNAADLRPLYQHKEVVGLAEVMDYPAVAEQDPEIMRKIKDAQDLGYHADGHGSGLNYQQLDLYRRVGIDTDHECTSLQEVQDRLSAGFHIFLREGSVERDLQHTVGAVTEENAQRFALCTDDKLISDIITEGSVDYCVRLAIEQGVRVETAYTMASYNAACAHKLATLGALSTGYQADLLVLDNLQKATVKKTMKKGQWVQANSSQPLPFKQKTVRHNLKLADLALPLTNTYCNIIGIKPNHIVTEHLKKKVSCSNGFFKADIQQDILKMVVVERHHLRGTFGLGLVHGFGLRNGAVATTVAHDSHNIVAVGTDDASIYTAIQKVTACDGGIAVASNGKITACMPLPLAGLMSQKSYVEAADDLKHIMIAYKDISSSQIIDFNPFITLSFLTLPVIPSLKLTDQGLYDFEQGKFISVEVTK